MFRIRRIQDDTLPGDRRDLERAQQILRDRLPGIHQDEVDKLGDRLRDPLKYQLRAILLVADDMRGHLFGFALVSYAPDIGFCLLDYVAAERGSPNGVGGALYHRVRTIAAELQCHGLFFECLPDEPEACSNPAFVKPNSARLRFYERLGARPIVGTEYERPLKPGDKDMPHLVFDDLDRGEPLRPGFAQRAVRAILERKYADLCPPEYIDSVVASFRADPVAIRPPRYRSGKAPAIVTETGEKMVALVVNEHHEIHHVRERGYVEAPVRVASILKGLETTGLFLRTRARDYPQRCIRAVHSEKMVRYLERVSPRVPAGKSVYPYVFPLRNRSNPPKDLTYGAGYYCMDTFTPLNRNAYTAAKAAVDAAMTGADLLLEGQPLAYALVRPPGHHAERDAFGGFCYFNNNAIAAHHLSRYGKVAILDVDYHHGNGQQDIFWERADVLTISIHAHPRIAYPFFTGFPDEKGGGEGEGFNHNLCLPERVDGERYRRTLRAALKTIRAFAPRFLVIALGLDTAKQDPTGTWTLSPADFEANGRLIGEMRLPTLAVQEGGYRTATLGANARAFFVGLVAGYRSAPPTKS